MHGTINTHTWDYKYPSWGIVGQVGIVALHSLVRLTRPVALSLQDLPASIFGVLMTNIWEYTDMGGGHEVSKPGRRNTLI